MSTIFESGVKLRYLGSDGVARVHNAALNVLERTGVLVGNGRAKERLMDEGARNIRDDILSIPHGIVERALSTTPREFSLYSVNGEEALILNKRNMYFGVSTSSLSFIDPLTSLRIPHEREHSSFMAVVADSLPNVHFLGNGGLMADIDPKLGGRMNVTNTLRYTTKPMYFCPDYASSYADIIEMAQDLAGGAERLREKPFLFGYCEPVSPLFHSGDGIEKLILCGASGVPVVYMPYAMRGATGPITLAGMLAQCFAEILSGLVIHQLFHPGAPFVIGCMPTVLDMKSSVGSYAAPEFHYGVHAASEICDSYGIPFFGTAGCCDAEHLDMQAATEATMSMHATLLSGADIVHDLAVMHHASAISPELLVYENEVLDMLSAFQHPADFADEDFLTDVIHEIGPQGNYLEHKSTLKGFRKVWYPKLFEREMASNPVTERFRNALRERTIHLRDAHDNTAIVERIGKILEEHEKKWRKNLAP